MLVVGGGIFCGGGISLWGRVLCWEFPRDEIEEASLVQRFMRHVLPDAKYLIPRPGIPGCHAWNERHKTI